MGEDANLIWAWFGFAFLMLLFRAPFAAQAIRMDAIRFIQRWRAGRLKTLMGGHETRGPDAANV